MGMAMVQGLAVLGLVLGLTGLALAVAALWKLPR